MFVLPSPDPAIEISAFSQGVSKGLRQTDGIQIVIRPEVAVGPLVVLGYYKNVSGPADGEGGGGIGLRRRLGGMTRWSRESAGTWQPPQSAHSVKRQRPG